MKFLAAVVVASLLQLASATPRFTELETLTSSQKDALQKVRSL